MQCIHYPYHATDFNNMPYRSLGDSGLKVSNVGLGTWKFGMPETGDGSRVDLETSHAIMDRALELGVTFWDTANAYNASTGNSERVIGSWFKKNPAERRNIVLATKVEVGMEGFTPNHSGLSRGNIMDGVNGCLKRLNIDYIDLLYFHHRDDSVPVAESLETVEDLVRMGKVRYFAVSNFRTEDIAAYEAVNREMTRRTRITAVQNEFNILLGETLPGVLDCCEKNKMAFIAYSPLCRGLLTGKYRQLSDMGDTTRMVQDKLVEKFDDKVFSKLNKLIDLAESQGVSLSTLVLAYMLTMPGMGAVIPASSSVKQLEQNALAGTFVVEDATKQAIKSILNGD